jgi:hypothetical protein
MSRKKKKRTDVGILYSEPAKCLHGKYPLSDLPNEERWGMSKGVQVKIVKCSTCNKLDIAQYIDKEGHRTVKQILTEEEFKHYDPR